MADIAQKRYVLFVNFTGRLAKIMWKTIRFTQFNGLNKLNLLFYPLISPFDRINKPFVLFFVKFARIKGYFLGFLAINQKKSSEK